MSARIYRPSKTATQSGRGRAKHWLLVFEPGSPCEIDPLMGWTGSGNTKSQIRLSFGSKEEAVAYAEKNGVDYKVEEPKQSQRVIMAYSDNFKSTRLGQWTH
jgi:hypothetical protein